LLSFWYVNSVGFTIFANSWPSHEYSDQQQGGRTVDAELLSEQVQVERKLFTLDLRENPRGRFLRVTEDVGGRRDTIIIPSTGLKQVREILDHAIQADEKAGPCEPNFD